MKFLTDQYYFNLSIHISQCRADVEAFIDFHEEENIEDNILDSGELKKKKESYRQILGRVTFHVELLDSVIF